MESGYYFMVLHYGAKRRRMLFEQASEECQDSAELIWQLEQAADQQASMEEYLSYVTHRLSRAGYRLVTT